MDGGIMAENYNGMAVGIFELDSFAACFVALDAAFSSLCEPDSDSWKGWNFRD